MAACPVCSFPLFPARHGATRISLCRRCGGALIGADGIKDAYGGLGQPSQWPADELREHPEARYLACPDDGAAMQAISIVNNGTTVVVDVCKQCGGLWLDAEEGDHLAAVLRGEQREGSPRQPGFRSYLFQLFTGMPLEVWHPVRRRPVIMQMLVATLIALFVVEGVMIGSMGEEPFARLFGLVPREFLAGNQLWSLLTHGFIHGGVFHLVSNLYFLWIFGDNVEDTMGRPAFVWIYGLAMVAGGLLEVVMSPDSPLPRLGASGAVAGLMGAYLMLFPHVKVWVVWFFVRFKLSIWVYLGMWGTVQLISAAAGVPGIAWYAHIGGFVAGMAAGLRYKQRRGGLTA